MLTLLRNLPDELTLTAEPKPTWLPWPQKGPSQHSLEHETCLIHRVYVKGLNSPRVLLERVDLLSQNIFIYYFVLSAITIVLKKLHMVPENYNQQASCLLC